MAANATAPKPVKKPSRQPPSETVWVRYHPWMEGAMGHLASWSIHLLIIGVAVLVSLAYAWGFIKHNQQLPVEPAQLADAGGGGSQEGSGDGPGGEHPPLKEDVHSDKSNDGNTTKPTEDRPRLNEVQAKQLALEFPSADPRYIQQPTEAIEALAGLTKEVRAKLYEGINPSKGNGGTGKDDGNGPGTGKGNGRMLTDRVKRMLRWTMKFDTHGQPGSAAAGTDYLHQLEALGAILAIPVGPEDQFKIYDLSTSPPQPLDKDISTIQRIWWIDNNPASVHSLMLAMGLNMQPSRVVAFIPRELEDELAQKELAAKGLKEDQIFETTFAVVPVGGRRYDVRVINQKAK